MLYFFAVTEPFLKRLSTNLANVFTTYNPMIIIDPGHPFTEKMHVILHRSYMYMIGKLPKYDWKFSRKQLVKEWLEKLWLVNLIVNLASPFKKYNIF